MSEIIVEEDPELTSSHKDTEATPTYGAVPPKELEADQAASAQQMFRHI